MIQSLLALFSTSGLRRALLALGGLLAAAGLIALRLVSSGRAAERARQDGQSLDNLRSRERTDDAVDRLDDSARRDQLSRWVRDKEQ